MPTCGLCTRPIFLWLLELTNRNYKTLFGKNKSDLWEGGAADKGAMLSGLPGFLFVKRIWKIHYHLAFLSLFL